MESNSAVDNIHTFYVAHLPNSPELRTFKEWISFGKKFGRLAGGGTIYLLLLIAGLDLRSDLMKLSQVNIFNLGEMLRKPSLVKGGESIVLLLCFTSDCYT